MRLPSLVALLWALNQPGVALTQAGSVTIAQLDTEKEQLAPKVSLGRYSFIAQNYMECGTWGSSISAVVSGIEKVVSLAC